MNKIINRSVLVLLLVSVGLCWWEDGHMAVSKIAQIKLKEKTNTTAYEKFNQLVKTFENLTDGKSNSFVEAAVWADDIKQYKANYFDDYHFTDIVYDPQFMFVNMADFQKDINSINVVKSSMTVLKTNKQSNTFERAFMARYLLHLVGDIHQPLHSACLFNQTFKTGDLGGNRIIIQTQKFGSMNLHAFLDAMGGIQHPDQRLQRPLTEEGKIYVESLAMQIMNEHPIDKFGDLVNVSDSHKWAVESYNYAVSDVYSFVAENKKTTPEWEEKIKTLCKERVALAGYRLANSISSIYE